MAKRSGGKSGRENESGSAAEAGTEPEQGSSRRVLSGIEWRAIVNGLAVGLIPLLFLQVGLGFVLGRLLPRGATASSYPAAWLMLVIARLVPFALGGYAAARTAGENAPLRHAVLSSLCLALVGMVIGALRPMGIPAAADLVLTTALALAASWWGARTAARRARIESGTD